MTNVITVNFAQRRAEKELAAANAPPKPDASLIGNLIFTIEAYGSRVTEPTNPKVWLCPRLNLWVVEVIADSSMAGSLTRMAFWYDKGYITYSTTCPVGEEINPAKAERVEEC